MPKTVVVFEGVLDFMRNLEWYIEGDELGMWFDKFENQRVRLTIELLEDAAPRGKEEGSGWGMAIADPEIVDWEPQP